MKKIGKFLKDLFTTNIPFKLLALVIAALTVFLLNIQ